MKVGIFMNKYIFVFASCFVVIFLLLLFDIQKTEDCKKISSLIGAEAYKVISQECFLKFYGKQYIPFSKMVVSYKY